MLAKTRKTETSRQESNKQPLRKVFPIPPNPTTLDATPGIVLDIIYLMGRYW
jgi:hypothetical protein